jgi:hypothetical protein
MTGPGFQDYLIAELRCASLRLRLEQSDVEAIGIALKGGLITPDQAIELLHDAGVLRLVGTERSGK